MPRSPRCPARRPRADPAGEVSTTRGGGLPAGRRWRKARAASRAHSRGRDPLDVVVAEENARCACRPCPPRAARRPIQGLPCIGGPRRPPRARNRLHTRRRAPPAVRRRTLPGPSRPRRCSRIAEKEKSLPSGEAAPWRSRPGWRPSAPRPSCQRRHRDRRRPPLHPRRRSLSARLPPLPLRRGRSTRRPTGWHPPPSRPRERRRESGRARGSGAAGAVAMVSGATTTEARQPPWRPHSRTGRQGRARSPFRRYGRTSGKVGPLVRRYGPPPVSSRRAGRAALACNRRCASRDGNRRRPPTL